MIRAAIGLPLVACNERQPKTHGNGGMQEAKRRTSGSFAGLSSAYLESDGTGEFSEYPPAQPYLAFPCYARKSRHAGRLVEE